MRKSFIFAFQYFKIMWEVLVVPLLILLAYASRLSEKKFDIGLGPLPLINNIYHKIALEKYGYSAETFVNSTYFITQKFDKKFIYTNRYLSLIALDIIFLDFIYAIFSYKCIYIYFNGGPLSRTKILWQLEAGLLRIAGIKTVVMPYGSDIHIYNRTPNLYLRHCAASDYPLHKHRYGLMNRRLQMWTGQASHVISGCDWVDYMYHWDTLMVAHFSIDLNIYSGVIKSNRVNNSSFRILHAPNHRSLKGTQFLVDAVRELRDEGLNIELNLAEGRSNGEILALIQDADLVVDQLVVGWYAMFALEAMVARKPVVCYLRDDLVNLYRCAGLIGSNEPPLINSSPLTIKADLRRLISAPKELEDFAARGYAYVDRVHSVRSVGIEFDRINKLIGIIPSNWPPTH